MIDIEIAPDVFVVPHGLPYEAPAISPAEQSRLDWYAAHQDDPVRVIVFDFNEVTHA